MRRLLVALVCIVSLLASAVGCASTTSSTPTAAPEAAKTASTSSAAPTAAASSSKAVQGITDTEIVLGGYHALSGALAAAAVPNSKTTQAFFSALNDQGGINGRKVRFIVYDDGFDPQKSLSLTKKLVEEDKVFAVYYGMSASGGVATHQYLVDKGIPHLMTGCPSTACMGTESGWYTAVYPAAPHLALLTRYAIKDLKLSKIGIFYVNNDFGVDNDKGAKEEITKSGGTLAVEVAVGASDTDMSAAAIKLKNSGAEAVVVGAYAATVGALKDAMTKIGYNPVLLINANAGITQVAQLIGSDADFYTTYLPAPDMSNNADEHVKAYTAALAKYAPDVKPDTTSYSAWLMNEVMGELLKRAGKDLTPAAIDKAALTMKDYGPLKVTYTADNHWGMQDPPIARWQNGKLTVVK